MVYLCLGPRTVEFEIAGHHDLGLIRPQKYKWIRGPEAGGVVEIHIAVAIADYEQRIGISKFKFKIHGSCVFWLSLITQ